MTFLSCTRRLVSTGRVPHARGMDATVDAGGPAFRDRPKVEWVSSKAPVAIAATIAATVLAAIALWVVTGNLPGVVADVLFALAIVIVISERALFTDPDACTWAGVVVLGFAWSTPWPAGSSCRPSVRRGCGGLPSPGGCTCWSG
jgi:hypothetical protein